MDLSKIRKGLFSVKSPVDEKKPEDKPVEKKEQISYHDYGFHQASQLGGTIPGLRVCLQKIYQDFREEIRADNRKQEELKTPVRVKIEDYKGHNAALQKRVDHLKTQDIPEIKKKIERLKEELSHIRKNPSEIAGDNAGKASLYIGAIILFFLTIYLIIFYSSASYSAFFKEFTLNNIGVAGSIFDPQAIPNAYRAGTTELILILTIPFSFLGLGYLIHKFQEQKGMQKFLKIGLLIVVTFVFDTILAYEITEKIYNIKKDNSYDPSIPVYSIRLAFGRIDFWLIIFAGFVVYLIGGFVFDFVMEAYGKADKVKVALKEKAGEIHAAELQQKDFETQIDKMNYTITENNREIGKLTTILGGTLIPREFEQDIYHFTSGWMAWMQGRNKLHNEMEEAEQATDEFVRITIFKLETINEN